MTFSLSSWNAFYDNYTIITDSTQYVTIPFCHPMWGMSSQILFKYNYSWPSKLNRTTKYDSCDKITLLENSPLEPVRNWFQSRFSNQYYQSEIKGSLFVTGYINRCLKYFLVPVGNTNRYQRRSSQTSHPLSFPRTLFRSLRTSHQSFKNQLQNIRSTYTNSIYRFIIQTIDHRIDTVHTHLYFREK